MSSSGSWEFRVEGSESDTPSGIGKLKIPTFSSSAQFRMKASAVLSIHQCCGLWLIFCTVGATGRYLNWFEASNKRMSQKIAAGWKHAYHDAEGPYATNNYEINIAIAAIPNKFWFSVTPYWYAFRGVTRRIHVRGTQRCWRKTQKIYVHAEAITRLWWWGIIYDRNTHGVEMRANTQWLNLSSHSMDDNGGAGWVELGCSFFLMTSITVDWKIVEGWCN